MKILKSILLAAVLSAPLAAFASAADVDAPMAPVQPTPSEMGMYLRGDLGWSMLKWSGGDDDSAFTLGGGVGMRFNDYVRSDVTLDWSGNYDVGARNISTLTLMGNGYLDLKNDTPFTPYLGAGIGYGFVKNNKDGVALGLMAGVAVDLNENLALDVGYKFQDIMASGPDVKEHMLRAGLRFSF